MSSNEFKAAIRAGEHRQAIEIALEGITGFEIISRIGKVGDRQTYRSRIDWVEGKVENVVERDSLEQPLYVALGKMHQSQVNSASATLSQRFECLEKLLAALGDLPATPSLEPQPTQAALSPGVAVDEVNSYEESVEDDFSLADEAEEEVRPARKPSEEDWGEWLEEPDESADDRGWNEPQG